MLNNPNPIISNVDVMAKCVKANNEKTITV